MKTLQQMGEHAAIAALTAGLPAVGDDCAVLPLDEIYDLVLTSDPLIENVHFTNEATPEQIGYKAVCRVLSDFAAMGAEPQYLLVNIVAPPHQDFQTLEKIYTEFSILRKKYGMEVVGGDLAQGPVLELHIFGVGRVPKGMALLRSGANAGDRIYVTGPLGGAQNSGKHLDFIPRLKEGTWLRASGLVASMMDISDGLATDLRHILKASQVGAELESTKIPKTGTLHQALYDGEDFELLFTVSEACVEIFNAQSIEAWGQPFPTLGTITAQANQLALDGVALDGKAFEHFKSDG